MKVTLLDWWPKAGDKAVCEAAWCSTYDRDQIKTEEQIDTLINMLISKGHTTPLESVWLKFYIECPIFVERQLDKYRLTQQFEDIHGNWGIECQYGAIGRNNITQNELSGRYRTIPDRFIEMPPDVSDILQKIKENPSDHYQTHFRQAIADQYEYYESGLSFLKKGVKENKISEKEFKRGREFIRGVLGTAFYTQMIWVLNLNSFQHIMNQRLASEAQVETREIAKMMLNEVVKNKVAVKVIQKMCEVNNWQCVKQQNTKKEGEL